MTQYRHPKTGTTVLRLPGHALRTERLHRREHKAWVLRAWCECGQLYTANGERTMTGQEARERHHIHLRVQRLMELATPSIIVIRGPEGVLR